MANMVKVKLLQDRCTTYTVQHAKDEIEVEAEEAKRMIAKGQCVPLNEQSKGQERNK